MNQTSFTPAMSTRITPLSRTQSTLGLKSKNEFVKSGWISQDHPFAEAAPNRGV